MTSTSDWVFLSIGVFTFGLWTGFFIADFWWKKFWSIRWGKETLP